MAKDKRIEDNNMCPYGGTRTTAVPFDKIAVDELPRVPDKEGVCNPRRHDAGVKGSARQQVPDTPPALHRAHHFGTYVRDEKSSSHRVDRKGLISLFGLPNL